MGLVCGAVWGQTTFNSIKLTSSMDQIQFEVPGENRYWFMSKTSETQDKAFALYSPDDGYWFTSWKTGTGDMILNKGNIGVGVYNPFSGISNNGIHISKGQHSSLLLGLPFSGYGGIVQTSDDRHRIFIGANLYDDQNNSWSNFQSGKGSAGISILADNGDWGSAISFMASNEDNSTVSRMYIKGNGKVGIGTTSPYNKLHIENGDLRITNDLQTGGDGKASIVFSEISNDPDAHARITYHGDDYSGDNNFIGFGLGDNISKDNSQFVIQRSGRVGIGTTTPSAKLDVNGDIKAHEIEVTLASINDMQLNGTLAANNITYTTNGNTTDFVFEDNYQLKDLTEVEAFIRTNKHLPEIPSAAEMEEAGVNLAEMNKLLLMKVEELTLYSIQLEKEVKEVRSAEAKARMALEERLNQMEKILTNLNKK